MSTPASLPADGNVKVTFVTAILNPLVPKATELNAASSVDLTAYLTPAGYQPSTDEATITDDRLSSRDTFEQPGRRTNTLQLMYVFRPQDVLPDNKAYTTLKDGVVGFIVERWGKAFEGVYAVADIVNVTPVKMGVQMEQQPEANSILKIAQKPFVTGPKVRQVAVVA